MERERPQGGGAPEHRERLVEVEVGQVLEPQLHQTRVRQRLR